MQISMVVFLFKYPLRTALAVGLSMAQIGEFAFVLLSVASQLGLLPYQVYMLLMGEPSTLALSLGAAVRGLNVCEVGQLSIFSSQQPQLPLPHVAVRQYM